MNFENSNLETKIFMQQHDCLTANLILPKSYNKVAINKFLQENYLDENGIIDSKKIITDFPSFDKIDELISKQQKVDLVLKQNQELPQQLP